MPRFEWGCISPSHLPPSWLQAPFHSRTHTQRMRITLHSNNRLVQALQQQAPLTLAAAPAPAPPRLQVLRPSQDRPLLLRPRQAKRHQPVSADGWERLGGKPSCRGGDQWACVGLPVLRVPAQNEGTPNDNPQPFYTSMLSFASPACVLPPGQSLLHPQRCGDQKCCQLTATSPIRQPLCACNLSWLVRRRHVCCRCLPACTRTPLTSPLEPLHATRPAPPSCHPQRSLFTPPARPCCRHLPTHTRWCSWHTRMHTHTGTCPPTLARRTPPGSSRRPAPLRPPQAWAPAAPTRHGAASTAPAAGGWRGPRVCARLRASLLWVLRALGELGTGCSRQRGMAWPPRRLLRAWASSATD